MRRTVLGIMVVAVVLLVGGAAAAQPEGDWREQCYGPDGPSIEEVGTTKCVKYGDGPWERVEDSGGFGIGFGEIVFFAILLSLVPAFAGAAMAVSAKVPAVAGFFTGLFLSWAGVIGLYLYGHWQTKSSPSIETGPAVERSTPDPSSAADRLRTLQDLLDQGLISQEEYRTRRQAAVDSL